VICYWKEWEPWTECTSDCIRTRQQLCYCKNETKIYDDSFCDGLPPLQYEPCNTYLCKNHKSIEYWQQYNCYGSGSFNQSWPIPETTLFQCDKGSNSIHSQMNWYKILKDENGDLWITLAQEYIISELNIANGNEEDSNIHEFLTKTEWILRDCDGFSEPDKEKVTLLIQVLKDYNNNGIMNNTVKNLEELSSIMGYNTLEELGSPRYSVSPTLISLISLSSILVIIGFVIFFWRKNTSKTTMIIF